ncbi:MAG: tetratricopeptide repeat protein [Oligoflexales bacterium]
MIISKPNIITDKKSTNAKRIFYESHPEEWEAEYELFENEDWEGLLNYRKRLADERVDSIVNQWQLAEAYIINGYYKKAYTLLSHLYELDHNNFDIQHHLLDVLYLQGLSEKDFNWVKNPKILHLDNNVFEICVEFLKPKRKPIKFSDIFSHLRSDYTYITFRDYDFFLGLQNDDRFVVSVQHELYYGNAAVSVDHKTKDVKLHYCWCCQITLPNKSFPLKNNLRNICNKCLFLNKEDIHYRQVIRNINRLITFDGHIEPKNTKALSNFAIHKNPRIKDYANKILVQGKEKALQYSLQSKNFKDSFDELPF